MNRFAVMQRHFSEVGRICESRLRAAVHRRGFPLGSPTSSLDIKAAIAEGRIVLVNLA
jgi:hypothetical protein